VQRRTFFLKKRSEAMGKCKKLSKPFFR